MSANSKDVISESSPVYDLFYKVRDPEHQLMGEVVPAMTSVLYRVCNNNTENFEEAMRLIELFMMAAYEKGRNSRDT